MELSLPVLILGGLVILEGIWIGWIQSTYGRKADQAWDGVDYLYDWIEVELKPRATTAFTDCGCLEDPNHDPTWPPEGPGDFPPTSKH